MDFGEDTMLTRKEVAQYLRISLTGVDRLAKRGLLRKYQISPRGSKFKRRHLRGRTLYRKKDVDDLLRRSRV